MAKRKNVRESIIKGKVRPADSMDQAKRFDKRLKEIERNYVSIGSQMANDLINLPHRVYALETRADGYKLIISEHHDIVRRVRGLECRGREAVVELTKLNSMFMALSASHEQLREEVSRLKAEEKQPSPITPDGAWQAINEKLDRIYAVLDAMQPKAMIQQWVPPAIPAVSVTPPVLVPQPFAAPAPEPPKAPEAVAVLAIDSDTIYLVNQAVPAADMGAKFKRIGDACHILNTGTTDWKYFATAGKMAEMIDEGLIMEQGAAPAPTGREPVPEPKQKATPAAPARAMDPAERPAPPQQIPDDDPVVPVEGAWTRRMSSELRKFGDAMAVVTSDGVWVVTRKGQAVEFDAMMMSAAKAAVEFVFTWWQPRLTEMREWKAVDKTQVLYDVGGIEKARVAEDGTVSLCMTGNAPFKVGNALRQEIGKTLVDRLVSLLK